MATTETEPNLEAPSTPKQQDQEGFNGPSSHRVSDESAQFERLLSSPVMQEMMKKMVTETTAEEMARIEKEKKELAEERARLEEEKANKGKKGVTKKPKKKRSKRGANAYSPRDAQKSQDEAINDISTTGPGDEENADAEKDDFNQAVEFLTEVSADEKKPTFANARVVTLTRGAPGDTFGVSLRGGIDQNTMLTIVPDNGDGPLAPEGEMILEVNDSLVTHMLRDELEAFLKGLPGDEITVNVSHADPVPKCADILRAAVKDDDPLTLDVAGSIRKAVQAYTTPYTTRPRREGEVDGREYHFVSVEEFERMVGDNAFFEYSTHPQTGAYYGSPIPKVEEVKQAKHINRHRSLKQAAKARANEATVGHVLAGVDPEGTHSAAITSRVGKEEVSVSEFLMSVPEDDEALADARKRVKAAYYNLTCPYTTRPKREGEKDGREYNFVSVAEFKALLEQGRMLEYGVHGNHMYGTAKLDREAAMPTSPLRTSMPSRSAMLKAAASKRKDDAKVGDLLRFSSARGTREYQLVSDTTVSEFLKSTAPDDPVYAGLRKQVKTWAYDCTVPYTTRPRRETEIEGREYHFVTKQQFADMVEQDDFLEYGKSGAFWYGTPRVTTQQVRHASAQQRHSRARTMREANSRRSSHVKVGQLLDAVTDHQDHRSLAHNGKSVGDHTVSELLSSVDADHPELGKTRSEVKKAIWAMMVPYTTRPPREGEKDGREYHFVSRKEFLDLLAQDKFIEHGARNGFLYGTPVPTPEDIQQHVGRKSAGHLRMSLGAALVGEDEVPELTVGHFNDLIEGGCPGIDPTMLVSKFFHHVEDGHPEFGAIRSKIKQQILDMTIPYTTRSARAGETDGVEYHFVTRARFEDLIAKGFFFEFGTVKGEYYGTPRVTTRDLNPHDKKPRSSRAATMKAKLAAAREADELTVGHFVERDPRISQHSQIAQHADVPLSVFFAHAAHGHEAHTDTINQIREAMYDMSTPYTTRPRREGERDGLDYHFISDAEFEERKARGEFLECGMKNNGYKYATPKLTKDHGKAPRSRRAELADYYNSKMDHATLGQTLSQEQLAGIDPRLHGMTVGYFLSKTSVDDPRYARLRAHVKNAVYAASVPWTTRPPRDNEVQDDHYHFCSKEEFDAAVDEDKFLEWGEHNGYYYGTLYPQKDQLDENGRLKKRVRRSSEVAAMGASKSELEEMKAKLHQEVQDKMHLQNQLEAIKGKLTQRDENMTSDQLIHEILALLADKNEAPAAAAAPAVPPPTVVVDEGEADVDADKADAAEPAAVVDDEEKAALARDLEAHKAELDSHKEELKKKHAETEQMQQELARHKEDLDMMRASVKSLNTALQLQKATEGLTPEQVGEIVRSARTSMASSASGGAGGESTPAAGPAASTGDSLAAPGQQPQGKPVSALKAKMLARRSKGSATSGTSQGSEESISPLKRKLMERRKAKLSMSNPNYDEKNA